MPAALQKHESEIQDAFNRGRESANIDNLSDNFKEHEKYDNLRFEQLKIGLKDNCDATNHVADKIDNLILVTKTRNDVAVEAAEKNLTTKKLYIATVSAFGTVSGIIIAIYEIINHIHG